MCREIKSHQLNLSIFNTIGADLFERIKVNFTPFFLVSLMGLMPLTSALATEMKGCVKVMVKVDSSASRVPDTDGPLRKSAMSRKINYVGCDNRKISVTVSNDKHLDEIFTYVTWAKTGEELVVGDKKFKEQDHGKNAALTVVIKPEKSVTIACANLTMFQFKNPYPSYCAVYHDRYLRWERCFVEGNDPGSNCCYVGDSCLSN